MGYISPKGSEWKKWDLHVHTPSSLVHNFKPKDDDDIWERYIKDLESLPEEFKVIGINDYLFIDGYRKVLEYKLNGRLKNIDLILPVIEFRIKKFAGNKQFKRINFHIIFSDEVTPDLIQNQFLNGLTSKYHLSPGTNGIQWNGVVTPESLADLGKKIKESIPEDQNDKYGSDLQEGFNNLNLDETEIIKLLKESTYFTGKFLFAIGKTEWDSLSWTDGSIAEKKDIINKANIVFTAAESPQAYFNAKNKLKEQKVNDLLLDCSDAHNNSDSTDKDRIGNCFTWIKADRTFDGLKQIVTEPERVFIGETPEILNRVQANKTKYIESLKIERIADYKLNEEWFNDSSIEFNHELVAIIGNKGNGKSAIADILGLLGNTKNHEHFSFLNTDKFKKASPNRSLSFNASLNWKSGETDSKNLNDKIIASAYEKVKYIPQNYLEKLCNDNQTAFENELRKVIFSHVSEADKLGQLSLEELIKYKSEIIFQKITLLKDELNTFNERIIELEKQRSSEFQNAILESLKTKKAELESHNSIKPVAVIEPSASDEIKNQQKESHDKIKKDIEALEKIEEGIKAKNTNKLNLNIELSELKKFQQAIAIFQQQYEKVKTDYKAIILKYGFDIDKIIALQSDLTGIAGRVEKIEADISEINNQLNITITDSLAFKKEALTKAIKEAQAKLDEPSRLYQEYLEAMKAWQLKETQLIGNAETDSSIKYYEAKIKYLNEHLQSDIDTLRIQRLEKTKELFAQKAEIIKNYKGLYSPVTNFINQYGSLTVNYPITLDVSLQLTDFSNKFFTYISQGAKGTYYGKEESVEKLSSFIQSTDFNSVESITAFIEKIITSLEVDQREGYELQKREIENQIRKGFYLDFYNYIFGLDYLVPGYELKLDNKSISALSPGEKGALLLIFYLILDRDEIPLVIDQPEENLDNQSVFTILVPFIREAKKRRQIIIVTHNPNLAVVCDAEQIIHVVINKADKNKVHIHTGAIESLKINNKLVEILEGTLPAFNNRDLKYSITKQIPN